MYISLNENRNDHLRIELISHKTSIVSSLLSNPDKRYELNIAEKVQRYTNASAALMKRILEDAHQLTPKMVEACDKCLMYVTYVLYRETQSLLERFR